VSGPGEHLLDGTGEPRLRRPAAARCDVCGSTVAEGIHDRDLPLDGLGLSRVCADCRVILRRAIRWGRSMKGRVKRGR